MSETPPPESDLTIMMWMHGRKRESPLGGYLPSGADDDAALLYAYRVACTIIDHGTAAPSGVRLNGVEYSMRDLHDKFGPWTDHV